MTTCKVVPPSVSSRLPLERRCSPRRVKRIVQRYPKRVFSAGAAETSRIIEKLMSRSSRLGRRGRGSAVYPYSLGTVADVHPAGVHPRRGTDQTLRCPESTLPMGSYHLAVVQQARPLTTSPGGPRKASSLRLPCVLIVLKGRSQQRAAYRLRVLREGQGVRPTAAVTTSRARAEPQTRLFTLYRESEHALHF